MIVYLFSIILFLILTFIYYLIRERWYHLNILNYYFVMIWAYNELDHSGTTRSSLKEWLSLYSVDHVIGDNNIWENPLCWDMKKIIKDSKKYTFIYDIAEELIKLKEEK